MHLGFVEYRKIEIGKKIVAYVYIAAVIEAYGLVHVHTVAAGTQKASQNCLAGRCE